MADGLDETTSQTIELLNYRLRRAHFLIYGSVGPGDSPEEVVQPVKDQAVSVRLRCIEAALAQLSSKSRPIQEYLWLCKLPICLMLPAALTSPQIPIIMTCFRPKR